MNRFEREIAKHVFHFPGLDVVAVELRESFFDVPRAKAALVIGELDQSDGSIGLSPEWRVRQRENDFTRRRRWICRLTPQKIANLTQILAKRGLGRVQNRDLLSNSVQVTLILPP